MIVNGVEHGTGAHGAPNAAMLLPPAAILLKPSDALVGAGLGTDAGSGQIMPEQVAAQISRAGQAGLIMSARLRASAAEHAPEMRRQAALAAQAAGKGASAALGAAVGATEGARKAWTSARALPGLRRSILLGSAAMLAALLGGGWLLARQEAIYSARREVPAVLARLGLAGTISYTDLTASPFGSVTLEHVTWRDGPQLVPIDSVTVSNVAQAPSGLRRGTLRVKGMAIPIVPMRENLPPGIGNTLLGLGYIAPRTDLDASLDLDDASRMLSADINARAADLGSAVIHLRLSGITTAVLAPLAAAYAQKFGLQSDQRFGPEGMFAMQTALETLTRLALVEASITLDDGPFAARAVAVPAQSMPDESASPDEQERAQRFLTGLVGLVAPDDEAAAQQAAQSWLKDGGRLVISVDPTSPVGLFTAGDQLEPALNLNNPATLAQANISIRR
jgi:hypothetical protein